ncbi:MAG: L,D-transpeptidase family protein [Candidatus Eremiobacterota bacterium]
MRAAILLVFLLCAAGPARAEEVRPLVGSLGSHTAVEGETLLDIAARYGLAIDHLCFANDWPATATRIYPGTPVVLPLARILPANPPSTGLVINLPERGLYFFKGGRFQGFYAISIGLAKDYQTPTGSYSIVSRVRDPVWYPPAWAKEKKPVGPGPNNPLGDRWLGLSLPRYGIHSTNKPLNVGLSTTHGCIRMYPDAIRSLFEQVTVGTPVRIEYETAKVGRGADGQVYLTAFPDVYKRSDPVEAGRKVLVGLGLGNRWCARLADELKRGRGLPVSLEAPLN